MFVVCSLLYLLVTKATGWLSSSCRSIACTCKTQSRHKVDLWILKSPLLLDGPHALRLLPYQNVPLGWDQVESLFTLVGILKHSSPLKDLCISTLALIIARLPVKGIRYSSAYGSYTLGVTWLLPGLLKWECRYPTAPTAGKNFPKGVFTDSPWVTWQCDCHPPLETQDIFRARRNFLPGRSGKMYSLTKVYA